MKGIPFTIKTDLGTHVMFESTTGEFKRIYCKISENNVYCKKYNNYYSLSNTKNRREVIVDYPMISFSLKEAKNIFLNHLENNYYYKYE